LGEGRDSSGVSEYWMGKESPWFLGDVNLIPPAYAREALNLPLSKTEEKLSIRRRGFGVVKYLPGKCGRRNLGYGNCHPPMIVGGNGLVPIKTGKKGRLV